MVSQIAGRTLTDLQQHFQFSKEEVKALYRAFKQECPSGISDEETFREVYQKIFPLGDSSKYAGLVFRSIDQNKTGTVTFGQFLDFLSLLSKGSLEEKILWTFTFYDVNKDGFISQEEMLKVSLKTFRFIQIDVSTYMSNCIIFSKIFPQLLYFILN